MIGVIKRTEEISYVTQTYIPCICVVMFLAMVYQLFGWTIDQIDMVWLFQ